MGSGDYGRYFTDTQIKDDDGFDMDDSDYDIFIEEVSQPYFMILERFICVDCVGFFWGENFYMLFS